MARPTIFKPEYLHEIDSLMSEGKLDYQICAKWDISESTLKRWKNDIPEFKEAYDRAFPKCETWWAKWGELGMQGLIKGFNFMAWQSFMNNKFKWTTKGESSNTINIGNMNVLSTKSADELTQILNHKLNQLSRYQEIQLIDDQSDESK